MPHRAFLEGVPDAAFYATYAGQLLGLYLAHRVARVRQRKLFLKTSSDHKGESERQVCISRCRDGEYPVALSQIAVQ